MNREGGSSGSRSGPGGNQQHMNRVCARGKGDKGAKIGRRERLVSSLSSPNTDITHCGQAFRHTAQSLRLCPETTPHDQT